MPFGMGFGELVLVLIIVVVVFGATRLPDAENSRGRLFRGEQLPPRLLLERRSRWTPRDWATAGVCVLLAIATLVLLLGGNRS